MSTQHNFHAHHYDTNYILSVALCSGTLHVSSPHWRLTQFNCLPLCLPLSVSVTHICMKVMLCTHPPVAMCILQSMICTLSRVLSRTSHAVGVSQPVTIYTTVPSLPPPTHNHVKCAVHPYSDAHGNRWVSTQYNSYFIAHCAVVYITLFICVGGCTNYE